jgi:hypothetical protein
MKQILIALLLLVSLQTAAQKKWNYKIGLVTPLPVNVTSYYSIDVSSALIQVNYQLKEKWHINATTGYLRFRPNEEGYTRFSNIPLLVGFKYYIDNNFYVGVMSGPVSFNEAEPKDNFMSILYTPYFGWQKKSWSVELLYFNWEEVPNEYNNLSICVSYNF